MGGQRNDGFGDWKTGRIWQLRLRLAWPDDWRWKAEFLFFGPGT
jgi:hypothetical protein